MVVLPFSLAILLSFPLVKISGNEGPNKKSENCTQNENTHSERWFSICCGDQELSFICPDNILCTDPGHDFQLKESFLLCDWFRVFRQNNSRIILLPMVITIISGFIFVLMRDTKMYLCIIMQCKRRPSEPNLLFHFCNPSC